MGDGRATVALGVGCGITITGALGTGRGAVATVTVGAGAGAGAGAVPFPATCAAAPPATTIRTAAMAVEHIRTLVIGSAYRLATIAALAVSSDTTGNSTALAPAAPCSIVTVAAL